MAIVWDHYPKGGSEKLVLLALADWCNDKGESLHPSVASVAAKVCTSERQTQRIMGGFVDQGILEVVGNQTGGAPGATRQYRLRLDRIKLMRPETGDADVTPRGGPRGDTHVTPEMASTGDAHVTPTGDTHVTGDTGDTGDIQGRRRVTSRVETGDMGVTQSTIEPPIEPPEEKNTPARPRAADRPASVPAEVWASWLQVRRAKRAGPVTPVALAGIEREASRAGLTVAQALTVCCERSWAGFRAEWFGDDRRAAGGRDGPYEGRYGRALAELTGGRMGGQPSTGGDLLDHDEPVRLPFARD